MTVHARQLARICRERMVAQDEESLITEQPGQDNQQQPAQADPRSEQRENVLS
ncbi:hypothetical protein [Actinophytocola xanthii]|uniref:hypothetical protein n=1 Tax=Actinophytocola xanthii TaxID=1912961 RepID=UPI0013015B21|nr:hypothetical protein [Actinophytocola xanthii]